MVCPKCKKEYINSHLASFSSGFESAAKNFIENNKPITHCENCKIKLIEDEDKSNILNKLFGEKTMSQF